MNLNVDHSAFHSVYSVNHSARVHITTFHFHNSVSSSVTHYSFLYSLHSIIYVILHLDPLSVRSYPLPFGLVLSCLHSCLHCSSLYIPRPSNLHFRYVMPIHNLLRFLIFHSQSSVLRRPAILLAVSLSNLLIFSSFLVRHTVTVPYFAALYILDFVILLML